MSEGDGEWIADQGERLNRQIETSAARLDWSVIETSDIFRYHGYCALGHTWFREVLESQFDQGNLRGSVHPNLSGHQATAQAVRPTVRTDLALPRLSRFTVRFQKIRVTDEGRDPRYSGSVAEPWNRKVRLGVYARLSACGHQFETVTGVQKGVWVDIHADPCNQFKIETVGRAVEVIVSTDLGTIDYHDVQRVPRDPRGRLPTPSLNRHYLAKELLRRADRFHASALWPPDSPRTLTTSHDYGSLEVTYTVREDLVDKLPYEPTPK